MKKVLTFLISAVLLTACMDFENIEDLNPTPEDARTMDELNIPEGFNFEMQSSVGLHLSAVTNSGNPMTMVPFSVGYVDGADTLWLQNGMIGAAEGEQLTLELPKTATEVLVHTSHVGLPEQYSLPRTSNSLSLVMGADNQLQINLSGPAETGITHGEGIGERSATFTYMGTYNNQGRPNYLMPQGDVVSADILQMVNASLPEGLPVPVNNPEYITNGTQTNVVLDDSAAVWITFVHEGAGYRNAIGYYTYPTSNPPNSVNQISQLRIIFPNASFYGSGGQMSTGDKVFLGNFPAGTTVAWFLVPNGWKQNTQNVSDQGVNIHYSQPNLNNFTTPANRSHMVLLADEARELLLMGFEDIDRPGGDKDFNDAVFYVTATPFTAVNTDNMVGTTNSQPDSDDDGVPDYIDENDEDPTYAFTSHFPAVGVNGTLAFEDSWPSKGDYDMNDMVLNYHFEQRRNAANKVTQLRSQFTLRAMGAGFRNGFGFQLPVAWDAVSSVSGQHLNESWVSLRANGTENGQDNATIIVFDNGYTLIPTPGGEFVNTDPAFTFRQPYSIEVVTNFSSPPTTAELGSAPFNPFLIANRERGREIHLKGAAPTDLADPALFNTAHDASNLAQSSTYRTASGLCWALNFTGTFAYPTEKTPINQAYLHFNSWATSGGGSFSDWFSGTQGYRNTSKIY